MYIVKETVEIKPAVPAVFETRYSLTATRAELEAMFGALNKSCVLDIRKGLESHNHTMVDVDALASGMMSAWRALKVQLERERKAQKDCTDF